MLLARARARARRLAAAEWGGLAVAAGLAVLLLATGLLSVGLKPSPIRWLALAGVAAAVGWAGRRLWSVRRGSGSDEAVARLVAAAAPALRSALVSAVELTRARDGLAASGAASLELLDAHVAGTTVAAAAIDLTAVLPARRARRAGWIAGGVALLWLLALGLGGAATRRQAGRLLLGDPAPLAGPSLEPITGDIELAFRFPAHTRRAPQLLSGTGGELRAPRGTEVTLRTRADRPVEAAELMLQKPDGSVSRRVALSVVGGRELAGSLLLEESGSYRFRFATARGTTVAEGPPIPLTAEPDAFPTVRITAPAAELELSPDATVRVEWSAEDDYGLAALSLILRNPGGAEARRPLRALTGLRRDAGSFDLPLGPERLGEGERLLYWLEVEDNDAVTGPKKGASATQAIKIYSEAEHRRAAMEKARAAWEQLIAHLGQRLELSDGGPVATPARLPLGAALDLEARALHQAVAATAAELRKDKVAPREVVQALANVAASLRSAEQRASAVRQGVSRTLAAGQPIGAAAGQVAWADDLLVAELEKDVLYLEQLLDKTRAGELVRLARELAARKRDLQAVLEKLRDQPGDAARAEALAQLKRLKARMQELQARLAETARGFNDQHLNAEALAELSKQKDMSSPLDAIEKAIQRGDVAAAMRSLDQLASQLDQLASGLEKTAAEPDARQRALMQELLAFKDQLEQVERQQQDTAARTEQLKNQLRQRLAPKLEEARKGAAALEQLAREARQSLDQAQPGVPARGEPDLDAAREALADLQRALALRDLEAAGEQAARAAGPTQRLQQSLEEDAALAERFPGATGKGPAELRAAQAEVKEAAPRIARIRDRLRKLTPDAQQAMTPGDRQKLAELAGQQQGLERQAGELQQKLGQLAEKAPIFPPQAQGLLGESRGHMGSAAGELKGRNPQRGHGEQQAALEGLDKFRKGLEQVARPGKGGGGFPFPFGETGGGLQEGEGSDPAPEKVVIPGAEAHKLPEEFRRDLLEAMKQGAPERYRGEVQRYYEELVK
jgi:hypothetical protein